MSWDRSTSPAAIRSSASKTPSIQASTATLHDHFGEERGDGFHEHRGRRPQQHDGGQVEGARGVDGGAAARQSDLRRIGNDDQEREQQHFGEALQRKGADEPGEKEETENDEGEVVDLERRRRFSEFTFQWNVTG